MIEVIEEIEIEIETVAIGTEIETEIVIVKDRGTVIEIVIEIAIETVIVTSGDEMTGIAVIVAIRAGIGIANGMITSLPEIGMVCQTVLEVRINASCYA